MKPAKKHLVSYKKASGSTTSDNTYADAAKTYETGNAINNNTKTMAAMMTQTNSTYAIMIIAIAGIVAYLIFKKK